MVVIFQNNKCIKEMSKNKIPTPDDWRRQGQEKYLKDIILVFRDYYAYHIGWEHDHCEFCGSKFSLKEGDLKKGYSTEDGYRWICNDCFNDFKEEFNWKVKE